MCIASKWRSWNVALKLRALNKGVRRTSFNHTAVRKVYNEIVRSKSTIHSRTGLYLSAINERNAQQSR